MNSMYRALRISTSISSSPFLATFGILNVLPRGRKKTLTDHAE